MKTLNWGSHSPLAWPLGFSEALGHCLTTGLQLQSHRKRFPCKDEHMATKLEQILQDVQALSPEDQRQLCRMLAETLSTFQAVVPATEASFQQQLVADGLL